MGAFASKALLYVTMDAEPSREKPADGVEWIAIRERLTLDQRARLSAIVATVEATKSLGQYTVHAGELMRVQNRVFICGWHLMGEDGLPVPFSEDAVGELDETYPLVRKAQEVYQRYNPFAQKTPKSTSAG